MPTLFALYNYPIKSCAGSPVESITLNKRGPEGDREFLITDENGHFLTQREHPKMALIKVRKFNPSKSKPNLWYLNLQFHDSAVFQTYSHQVVEEPQTVKVWDDECEAVDLGDHAAALLSDFIGVQCRLFRMVDSFVRPVDPRYSPKGGDTAFTDGFPFLLISDASLADLNGRLERAGKLPVTRDHFRSVLWAGDCEPFEEDTWKRIQIGSVVFDVVKPCARCVITTVNPETGVTRDDKEPLATLAKYRTQDLRGKKGVMFGQNLVHRGLGTLSLGDEITILERK